VAALDEAARLMDEDPAGARERVLVVLLPDTGRSYLSKLYNDEWMRVNALLGPATGPARVRGVLAARHGDGLPPVVLARTTDRVADAVEVLQQYGISQMPVSERPTDESIEGIVGSISEKGLLDRAYRDPAVVERTVGEVMDRPLPTVDLDSQLDEAFRLLSDGAGAVVAVSGGRPAGVVTKLDLLEFLAHRADGPARR
jgi:cystathionine beta-synthase